MVSSENKNLIVTYVLTLSIAIFLTVVIVNFNSWFFPNEELKLSEYTPASRGMISERDLKFGVLSDQKFTGLEPILQDQLIEMPTTSTATPTSAAGPAVKAPIELRRSNPFLPF